MNTPSNWITRRRAAVVLVALSVLTPVSTEASSASSPDPASALTGTPAAGAIASPHDSKQYDVRWRSLFRQSLSFLVIENAFRYASEPGTRDPDRPYLRGYIDSVGALHGWADGDPFYVNYVGHPMQGAVSGYLWTLNDPRYRSVEFGRDPAYWKSRIRAGAFAWAYSEMSETGPIMSEASIGNIQAFFPQQGFVDHVVTPAIGLGWMIAEDVLDRYLVRPVERRTENRYVRVLVRGGANPARSFSNVISGQWPWARPRDHGAELIAVDTATRTRAVGERDRRSAVAPFELAANAYGFAAGAGSGRCAGGGATAALRIAPKWQSIVDVNGCKMILGEKNLSGDSLTYMAGLRWTPSLSGRFAPYAQVLFGGNKLTQELMLPKEQAALDALAKSSGSRPPDHAQYTHQLERDGFATAGGVGLDLHLNRALALRLVSLEYLHSSVNNLNGFAASKALQLKTGMVLHMGTW